VTTPSSDGGPDVGARDGSTNTRTVDTESQRVRNEADTHGTAAERSAPPNVPRFGAHRAEPGVAAERELDRTGRAVEGGRHVSGSTAGRGRVGSTDRKRPLDGALVRRWIEEWAALVEANRDFLTQLDAAIGDADHGVNMHRGTSAAVATLRTIDGATPGTALQEVGTTIVYRVGGAAGPLYGSGLRQAGAELDDRALDAQGLLGALRGGLEAIQKLGAAEPGDKTIVDAWSPAVWAFEEDLRAGGDVDSAAAAAAKAAGDGVQATIPMQARKGRASYLGARSVGHQDPGATSTSLLFEALARVVRA
jgi:dihydroxyacetone kinase-like protein